MADYQEKMVRTQQMRKKFLEFMCGNYFLYTKLAFVLKWRKIQEIAYFLVIALIVVESHHVATEENSSKVAKLAIAIILLLLSATAIIAHLIEARALNSQFYWNFIYLCLVVGSLTSYYQPLFSSILIFDIFNKSKRLQNIIKSVTTNIKKILIFLLFGAFVIYAFSVIAWEYLKDTYTTEDVMNNTYSLFMASNIKKQMEEGDGIGSVLQKPSYDITYQNSNKRFWGFWWFDLIQFIIMQLLYVQIFTGIILDKFSELKE